MPTFSEQNRPLGLPGRFVPGVAVLIIGAGPAGLGVGAGLKDKVPYMMLEASDRVASLWHYKTYDGLKLDLPRSYFEHLNIPFPEELGENPTKEEFISYLEDYANRFGISPRFNQRVKSAVYDEGLERWRVLTVSTAGSEQYETEYFSKWLVVATGVNAEPMIPYFEGLEDFSGDKIHSKDFKSGEKYRGERVLVVGFGLSGKEISVKLSEHNAKPFIVVQALVEDSADSLKKLIELLPQSLGDKVKSGDITIVPGIKRFTATAVELVNGHIVDIDSVILATGYYINVKFLVDEDEFFGENGLPRTEFPNGCKGKHGFYAVGFTPYGYAGAVADARKVAKDIERE